ncbi:uncharacterized protein LOC107668355 [Sinocyclocheilus anshuiensis]|uniref:uncharacterized protein LOC107668355 n=1 Tax=Sinocyclocheilus anshuiensis TaxID=1608454 RepID=UPI0007B86938|nr:PREDICTED: uncharacterized protein LOC107668355 [Sinocyclocheilus anshuiensis]
MLLSGAGEKNLQRPRRALLHTEFPALSTRSPSSSQSEQASQSFQIARVFLALIRFAPISMDVNLTISLMRGQMGAVIEKAVNVAVETVLGEMIRVVGLKFEEIKRDMTAKEKENENIRRMLEASRCQMKTMRKYISVLSAKDPNHRLCQGDGDMATTSTGMHCRRGPTSTVSVCAKTPDPCPRPRVSEPAPVAAPSWVRLRQQMHMSKETLRSENHIADVHIEEIHGSSVHKVEISSPHLVDSQVLLSETSDPVWGQNPLVSAETGHTDMPDSSVLSAPMMADESVSSQTTSTVAFGAPSLKIKQEEAEVEIVCVKDEHAEAGSIPRFEYSDPELHQQVGEPELGVSLDLPASFQALQSPGTSADLAIPAFMSVDPTTYDDSQLSVAGVLKQVRPRRKDLNLYEEYKRSRTLRGRNTNRRRELEQTLPQALLADLVRERREKTRLRVARWRAKRKLQGCLMASQAAQFSGAAVQSSPAQRGSLISTRRRGGATAPRGGFGFRRGLSETGTYNLLLQLGPSPTQSAVAHDINVGLMPSGLSALSQHRTTAPRSTYQ